MYNHFYHYFMINIAKSPGPGSYQLPKLIGVVSCKKPALN